MEISPCYMLFKSIDCLSMLSITHKEGGFALLRLIGAVSGSFEPVLACCGLFQAVPLFRKFWLANLRLINFMLFFQFIHVKTIWKFELRFDQFEPLTSGLNFSYYLIFPMRLQTDGLNSCILQKKKKNSLV